MTLKRGLALALGLGAIGVGTAVGLLLYRHVSHRAEPIGSPPGHTQTQPGAPGAQPRPEVSITRPDIRQIEGGRLAWQVRLRELSVAAGAEAVSAAGMQEAVIYDKTGLPAIRLTAQQAKGNTADRSLEVSGDVKATSQKGALITTDRLRWLEQERRLVCPDLVTVRTRNAALTTRGLSYFVDSDIVKAPGLVRVYSGRNKLIGRQLVYNVETEAYEMKKIQAIFNPREVRSEAAPQR